MILFGVLIVTALSRPALLGPMDWMASECGLDYEEFYEEGYYEEDAEDAGCYLEFAGCARVHLF